MSAAGFFIAGTDTGAGKTRVSCALLQALNACGHRAVGMKPVASGAEWVDGRLISEDVREITASSPQTAAEITVNPYRFEPPVSPDIAAELAGIRIEIDVIVANFRLLQSQADLVVVEGTGGWLCPIGPRETMADVAFALGLPVILVVGLKLGCISHALLSAAAIRSRGCRLKGWIGNRVDPNYRLPETNLASLARLLAGPPLAVLPHAASLAATPDPALLDFARRLA
jgi:dethiobiotin synthetase